MSDPVLENILLQLSDLKTRLQRAEKMEFSTRASLSAAGLLVENESVSEDSILLDDVETNNSAITKHGFLKKLSNVATQWMNGIGSWSTPKYRIPFVGNLLIASVPGSTTYRWSPGMTAFSAATYNILFLSPGTLKNLKVNLAGAQPSGGSLVITIYKGGSATALSITVLGDAASGLKSNTTDEVSISSGDLVHIAFQNNNISASATVSYISFEFECSSI